LPTAIGRRGEWHRILSSWHDLVPALPMAVRIYDRRRLVDGDVVRDFLDAIERSSIDLPSTPEPVNPTLNELGVLGVLITWQNRHLFRDAHDRRFTDYLRHVGGDMVLRPLSVLAGWTTTDRHGVLDAYAPSNERLRQRYLPSLPPGCLFESDIADPGPRISEADAKDLERQLLGRALGRPFDDADLTRGWQVAFETHLAAPVVSAARSPIRPAGP
jgi:hypothetical protein